MLDAGLIISVAMECIHAARDLEQIEQLRSAASVFDLDQVVSRVMASLEKMMAMLMVMHRDGAGQKCHR